MRYKLRFSDTAKKELDYYKLNNELDKVTKIKNLIKSIDEDGILKGIGKPEILKHYSPKAYSRRIDKANRLVYRIEDTFLIILSCRGHYQE